MILADKIIQLRKKNGWSQEELAGKVNVSRQSVSKWEGAQSAPDLDKIILLSQLFGVTTDYLLKDDVEDAEYTEETESVPPIRKVSLQQANEYLQLREQASGKIALATFLCILSPICLLLLGVASEVPEYNISENFAGATGLITLLLFVAVAVAIFITCGSKSAHYEFLEKEPFETEYGVDGMVKQRMEESRDSYTRSNLIGTCICILSPVSLFVGAFSEKDFLVVVMLCVTLLLAGIGVMFFVNAGVKHESMLRLLQEGDYTKKNKKANSLKSKISSCYWLVAVAIYLAWSFYTNNWDFTWIVWPVAGVLYGAVMAVIGIFSKD